MITFDFSVPLHMPVLIGNTATSGNLVRYPPNTVPVISRPSRDVNITPI